MKTTKNRHYASITDPAEIGQLLRAIDGYTGQLTTLCALKFAPLVFTRPGELRKAEWSEIDFEAGQWCIPAEKMKMGVAHIVPLSKQALAVLRELHPLTSKSRYIFPSVRSLRDPMSENTVNAALRRLGYGTDDMTGHGFRSMASTLLHEMGWTSDAIERQLAHAERNPIKAAYNRAEHLPERRRMMQAWADYLDKLRIGTGKAKLLAVV
ncbi:MAG: tyrosine-type recombinase/integrase [Stenotrophomonas geniculata]